ncbi:A disintegrin and metalloproteinase with thrombospondin motifs 12 [Teleopsis dalmanni]|uniref:A disintegrin and metalloproteinase with thrombospondin motifs 12 n=1 Tax=Teleopsis dalmanni TaxID=139649 RepID=UPI0018CDDF20|nr:A disintegrin and metalloproteinase with thrombospondin motifs 12 [Teleopsis dalmanni]
MEPQTHYFLQLVLLIYVGYTFADQRLYGLHSGELASGELIIPKKVNRYGEFLTHNLTHHHDISYQYEHIRPRRNTEENSATELHYHLNLNSENLHLELEPHNYFMTPHLIIERHRRDLRTRRRPFRNTNCHFHGKVRGQFESRVAISTCHGLVGHIKTENNEYFIEPSKLDDTHSDGGHPHVIFQRSSVKEKPHTKTKRKNRKRKHQEHQHKSAVSNCGTKEPRRRIETRLEWQPQGKVKIQGGRKIRRHHFNQNHHNDNQQRHHRYQQQSQTKFKYQTAAENVSAITQNTYPGFANFSTKDQQKSKLHLPTHAEHRMKRSISSPRHVEALIVGDSTMVAFHNDTETYLLTIMNMVSALYKDPSIGNSIEIVVVKIILLEEESAHPGLNLTQNAQQNLDTFCSWQHKLNKANENEPYHHDVAILITRKNICGNNCMTLGLANVGGMCKPKKSCSVNEDNGIMLSHTIAHELGHNFGMYHDSAKIGCHPRVGSIVHIMTPTFGADTVHVSWSNCSRKFITQFLDQGLGDCLDNAPTPPDQYIYPEQPPGILYNAELQCRQQFNVSESNVEPCTPMNEICSALWCRVNGECVTNMRPTAPGTICGKRKWCQNGECVPMEEKITPINGGWGNWSEWSQCSVSCGGGISMQQRECNSPVPTNGGLFCIGERKRYKICKKNACPIGEQGFRAKQCANYDDIPYQGAIYKWQPFFDKKSPCKLFCTDLDDTIIANWGDVALDGTPCTLGTNNMCIDGICKKVGCDWIIDSDIQEDRCGVCGGKGDQCKTVKEVFNDNFNITEGYVEIVTIPSKARHIVIKELDNSAHFLGIARANSSKFYLNGESLISMPGEFVIAGAESLYDRIDDQETITIPQPIEHPITLYTIVHGNEPYKGIYYEFTLPFINVSSVVHFTWKLSNWTQCSASCGGGIQYREPICYKNGHLTSTDALCWSYAQNSRPGRISRPCNKNQCPAHWWPGPWQFCPVTCKSPGALQPLKRRSVVCLDQHEVVVEDNMCNILNRPAETEACEDLPVCVKSEKTKNTILRVKNL